MILVPFLYIWLAEPLGFQKEASVDALISQLGEKYVRPEYQHFLEDADCTLHIETTRASATESDFWKGVTTYRCSISSPCGTAIERPIWHRAFTGAFIAGDPFGETIGSVCPEMLTDAAREHFEATWQQGG